MAEHPIYPLSFEQESIWLNDQFQAGGSRYLESWVHHLTGPVDPAAVEAALTGLVQRHESLRSRVGLQAGVPVQTVLPPMPVPLAVVDIGAGELDGALAAAVSRQIPLDDPPLLRATLLRLAPDRAVLVVAIHHVVVDGWSIRLLDREFGELYDRALDGSPTPTPTPPPAAAAQLGAYAETQRRAAAAGMDGHLRHWLDALRDAPAESRFPAERSGSAAGERSGGQVEFAVEPAIVDGVRRLCRSLGTTPFVVLAGTFSALLARCAGQPDVVVGTPLSRRDRAELDSLFACLTDVMPIRVRAAPDVSFRRWLDQVREALWSAFDHRDLPFAHLVRAMELDGISGRSPVFQSVLTLEEPGPGLLMRDVEAERRYVHGGTAKFDVFLDIVPEHDGYRCYLEYATDRFDEAGAERLAARFVTLLADAVDRPDMPVNALRLVPASERLLLDGWGRGGPPAVSPAFHGAPIRIRDDVSDSDLDELFDLIEGESVDCVEVSPEALLRLAEYACDDLRHCESLRTVAVSGGPVRLTPAIRRFFSALTEADLEYRYGTDEVPTAIRGLLPEHPSDWPDVVCAGRPADGAVVRVLDAFGEPQPVGAVGEIWVGSVHLPQDGAHRSDVENKALMTDPLSPVPVPLKRTGTLGRFLADGRVWVIASGPDPVPPATAG